MTIPDFLFYEYPLNERIRVLIRIETLLNQIDRLLNADSADSTLAVMVTTGDLLSIIQRGDVKSELLKELDRHVTVFGRWQNCEGVNGERLQEVLDHLRSLTTKIHEMSGPFGADLKRNDFLSSVMQRCVIPGGTCDFDLPALHLFLSLPAKERQSMLRSWLTELELLQETTSLLMELTRSSVSYRKVTAESGIYNQSLDKSISCQMLQIKVPHSMTVYPEISGNKHQFTVRFMTPGWTYERPTQTADAIEFSLGVCVL